jgi:hypothetical protein
MTSIFNFKNVAKAYFTNVSFIQNLFFNMTILTFDVGGTTVSFQDCVFHKNIFYLENSFPSRYLFKF